MNFADILSNYYVKNLGIPIFSVFITASVKVISRKDHSLNFTKSDVAVGINLIVTGMIMLVNCSIKLAETTNTLTDKTIQAQNTTKMLTMLVLVLLYCIMAVFLSVLIRKYGWKKENESELNTLMGVLIPLILGSILIVVAANYSNQ